MEEQYDTPDPAYLKGFNEGYTLAQHMPDLAEQLGKATGESQRGTGFQAGRKQFLVERERERYPSWLKDDLFDGPENDRDKTKERDRGHDMEPER